MLCYLEEFAVFPFHMVAVGLRKTSGQFAERLLVGDGRELGQQRGYLGPQRIELPVVLLQRVNQVFQHL